MLVAERLTERRECGCCQRLGETKFVRRLPIDAAARSSAVRTFKSGSIFVPGRARIVPPGMGADL